MLKSKYFFKRINLVKYFNDKPATTPATTPGATQVGQTAPPQKTKEELKIEQLMSQWPEYIRNPEPEMIDNREIKQNLEHNYKFHQGDKPYIKLHDIPEIMQREIAKGYLAMSTDVIIDEFKEYEGFFSDNLIAEKFHLICSYHKDLTPEFYQYLIPLVKKIVAKADRHSNSVLAHIGVGAALINLGDKEFWDMYVRLYSYFRSLNLLMRNYIDIWSLTMQLLWLLAVVKLGRDQQNF
jgi:hypothetical protein